MKKYKLLFIDLGEIAKAKDNSFFCPAEVTSIIKKLEWFARDKNVTTIRCVKNDIVMLDAIRLTYEIQNNFGNRFKSGGAYSNNFDCLELLSIINETKRYIPTTDIFIIFTENKEMVVNFANRELIDKQIVSPITERCSFMVINYEYNTFSIV